MSFEWSAQSIGWRVNRLIFPAFSTPKFPHKIPPEKVIPEKTPQQLDDFTMRQQRSKISTVSKTLTRRASCRGSNLPFAVFFFLHACAVHERSMRTTLSWRHFLSTTLVLMPESITSNSISRFSSFKHGLDSSPVEPGSWPARAPWVLGFFSGRGKPLVLWRGNRCKSSREKGKRTDRNSWRYLRPSWKRTTCSTLAWFLAPALGSAVFPRAKFARGPTVLQNGRLHCGGAPESLVRSTQVGHPPLPRGWVARAKCSREAQLWEEREARESKREKKKNAKTEKWIVNFEDWQYWNKIMFY